MRLFLVGSDVPVPLLEGVLVDSELDNPLSNVGAYRDDVSDMSSCPWSSEIGTDMLILFSLFNFGMCGDLWHRMVGCYVSKKRTAPYFMARLHGMVGCAIKSGAV